MGITAGCSVVRVWGSILVGLVAAFVYHFSSCLMRKLQIDDPLDAFSVSHAPLQASLRLDWMEAPRNRMQHVAD